MPIGRAQVVREGSRPHADRLRRHAAPGPRGGRHAGRGRRRASADVIDLLTISPLDRETIVASVQKTGRAVVVHEAPRSFGPGAEIATSIMDGAFLSLEAPIARVTSWDVPFPGFAREKANVPDLARVLAAARETLAF